MPLSKREKKLHSPKKQSNSPSSRLKGVERARILSRSSSSSQLSSSRISMLCPPSQSLLMSSSSWERVDQNLRKVMLVPIWSYHLWIISFLYGFVNILFYFPKLIELSRKNRFLMHMICYTSGFNQKFCFRDLLLWTLRFRGDICCVLGKKKKVTL